MKTKFQRTKKQNFKTSVGTKIYLTLKKIINYGKVILTLNYWGKIIEYMPKINSHEEES